MLPESGTFFAMRFDASADSILVSGLRPDGPGCVWLWGRMDIRCKAETTARHWCQPFIGFWWTSGCSGTQGPILGGCWVLGVSRTYGNTPGTSTASGSLITDEHPRRFWRWEEETKVLSILWFKHVEMVYLDLNLILWGPNIRGLVPHHIKPSQPALEATRTTPGVNLAQLSCGSGHFLNAASWL